MARNSTLVKPEQARMVHAGVVRREQLSPSMLRVTLGGPELAGITPLGFDQWFRLFVPRPGQEEMRLPRDMSLRGYVEYLAMRGSRPLLRNYTFAGFRLDGDASEVDVDFVVHDAHEGDFTAARWAAECAAGDPVGILDEGLMFAAPGAQDWTLLAADESGLPAVAGVLASLPADATGLALIEVPTPEDIRPLSAPLGMELRWLPRAALADAHDVPGRLALRTLTEAALPAGRPYAFVVGESGLPTGARRHLVSAGVDKQDIAFCGYWKHGARASK